jgi:hypothetical protein
MATKVLLIDDDPKIVPLLQRGLAFEGFEVVTAMDGGAGLAAATTHHPQIVLLDICRAGGWRWRWRRCRSWSWGRTRCWRGFRTSLRRNGAGRKRCQEGQDRRRDDQRCHPQASHKSRLPARPDR